MFAAACAQYAADHPQIAADRKALLQLLGDGKEIGKQIKELESSLREYDILLDASDISPGRMKKLKAQRSQTNAQLESLQAEQRSVKGRKRKIKAALDALIEQSYCEERLARTILDQAIVQADKSVSFVFRDGYTCTVDYKSI
jgi:predicted RNase H-like nuclease (RuvC/YqgF family)